MEAADAWAQTGTLYLSAGVLARRVGYGRSPHRVGSGGAAFSACPAAAGTAKPRPGRCGRDRWPVDSAGAALAAEVGRW